MANAEKLLRALLGKGYKMPKTDIDKLLSEDTTDEDGETQVIDGDVARIGKLTTPKKGETFQDGYKKAKAEVLTQLEDQVKEKFEIESDATGVDLIELIVTEKGKVNGKPKELTDDDVRKHPVYQSAEKAHKIALKAKETEYQTKLDETTTQFKKGETFNTVTGYALSKLAKFNPVIPANATIASNIQRSFLEGLKQYDYEVQDGGNRIVMLTKDGKVADDGHGHSLEFDAFLQNHAAGFYDFKANNGGSNGGNGNPEKDSGGAGGSGGGTPAYPAGIVKPKTFEEVMVIVNNTDIPVADRQTVMNVWETESKTGTA
jgi:hypothetical protein